MSAAPPEDLPNIRNKKGKYADYQENYANGEKKETRQKRGKDVYDSPSGADKNQTCNECDLAFTDHNSCTSSCH